MRAWRAQPCTSADSPSQATSSEQHGATGELSSLELCPVSIHAAGCASAHV